MLFHNARKMDKVLYRKKTYLWYPYSYLVASLFFVSNVFLLVHSIHYDVFSVFFTVAVFSSLGLIILASSGYTSLIFFIKSFSLNIILSVVFIFYFEYSLGLPFNGVADDQTFFILTKYWANDTTTFDQRAFNTYGVTWESINYKAYILIFGFWLKFLKFLNIESEHFFHLNLINCWFGAFIPSLTFIIAKRLFTIKIGLISAFIVLLYTPVIFYSIIIIRDTLIGTIFLSIVSITISSYSSKVKIISITILLSLLFELRGASAALAIVFMITYWASALRIKQITIYNKWLSIVMIILVLATSIYLVSGNLNVLKNSDVDLFKRIVNTVNFYQAHSLEQASNDSFGSILKQSNNPIIFLLLLVYTYLSPVPPEFIKTFNLKTVFMGVGNILWYVVAPVFIGGYFQLTKDKSLRSILHAVVVTLVISLIVVSMTSGNPRHLYFLHPLIILFVVAYIIRYPLSFLHFFSASAITGFAGFILYLLLKST